MKALPQGTSLTIDRPGGIDTISIPTPVSLANFGQALFLLVWLGGWAFGEIMVARQLLAGTGDVGGRLFMVVWLCGWTLGGVAAMATLLGFVLPQRPETLAMDAGGITFTPGTELPTLSRNNQGGPRPKSSLFGPVIRLFRRPKPLRLDRAQLSTLRLRDSGGFNQLTVDVGVDRLYLATQATDVERNWLYDTIVDRYRLRPAQADLSSGPLELTGG